MFVKSLFTKQRLERSSFEKMTLHSLMMVVMTLCRCRSPTQYHLSRLGLMRAQYKDVLLEILLFFLVTIYSGYSEPNFSWYSINMCFFSRVPWTMMELLLDISWLAVTESLVWRRVTILDFISDTSVWDGWWSGSVGIANLDKSNAVNTFLEVVGPITKVLCSLLLRLAQKILEPYKVDKPLLVVRLGPRLLVRDVGIQSSKVFCDPMGSSRCNIGIRQVKPSYWWDQLCFQEASLHLL